MTLFRTALVALALSACGGDASLDPGTPRPALTRLALERIDTGTEGAHVVTRYTPDDDARPWALKKDEPLAAVESEGRAVVRIAVGTPVSVQMPADLSTKAFDRIDLVMRIPAGEEEVLRLTLFRERTKILVSEVRTVLGTGAFETLSFPLPGIERLDDRVTTLTAQIVGNASAVEFAELVVIDDRPAALLPAPGGEPALIDLGTEARRGWGLDARVSGQVVLPAEVQAGDRLRFSYAVHPAARGATLVVERPDATDRLSLTADQAGWLTYTIDPVPAALSLRVEDADPADMRAWTAITELCVESPRSADLAPLVVLFTSDTHRGDHLGRGGTPGLVRTPNLDALAERGVQFLDAYAPTNMTNPAHASLMTGLSPRDTRIVGNRAPLAEAATTLAERFAAAGWATAAAVSVQHIGHAHSGLGQGFDRYDGLEERTDYRFSRREGDIAVARALEWIEGRSDVPLFLWIHVFDVHAPYSAPAEYERRYLTESGRPVTAALDPVPGGTLPSWIEDDAVQRAEVLDAHARYRAAVDRLDTMIAPLLDHARVRAGTIAVTGDHGEAFGRNQLWWTHHGLYRDQLHVPLIVASPKLQSGRMLEAPASMMDLGATLLDLAGLDFAAHPAPRLDFDGTRASEPRFALGYGGQQAAIQHEGWLLVLNLMDHDYEKGPRHFAKGAIELFHVTVDPACARELSNQEQDRTARLRSALVRWLGDANDEGFATAFNVSASAQRRLVELGYAGNTESTRDGAWFVEEAGGER